MGLQGPVGRWLEPHQNSYQGLVSEPTKVAETNSTVLDGSVVASRFNT